MDFCFYNTEISRNRYCFSRDEWIDVDILRQLPDWWTVRGRVRARDERKKFP